MNTFLKNPDVQSVLWAAVAILAILVTTWISPSSLGEFVSDLFFSSATVALIYGGWQFIRANLFRWEVQTRMIATIVLIFFASVWVSEAAASWHFNPYEHWTVVDIVPWWITLIPVAAFLLTAAISLLYQNKLNDYYDRLADKDMLG